MSAIRDFFLAIAWKQDRHDSIYHADIYTMNRKDNLTHMTMHLSKYLGKLITDDSRFFMESEPILIDALIVLVSMANRMNYCLADNCEDTIIQMADYDPGNPALSIQKRLYSRRSSDDVTRSSLCLEYAVQIGKISKALEAVDHMEDFPVRQHIVTAISKLFMLTMALFGKPDIGSFGVSIKKRLESIEEKNFMYQYLPKYKDDFKPVDQPMKVTEVIAPSTVSAINNPHERTDPIAYLKL